MNDAPAEQETSYKIVKDFTGITGNIWKKSDEFTVEIRSADSETIDTVKNGNLSISGFDSTLKYLKELPDGTGWKYTFTSENYSSPLEFKSFKFKDIEFPVQYVDSTGKVWETPTQEDITAEDLTPQTRPVTYWLSIDEKIPEGASENVKDGITYDKSVYYLQIILRNA